MADTTLTTEQLAALGQAFERFGKNSLPDVSKRVEDFGKEISKGRRSYTTMGPVLKELRESLEDTQEEYESLTKKLKQQRDEYDTQLSGLVSGTAAHKAVSDQRKKIDGDLAILERDRGVAMKQYTTHMKNLGSSIAAAGITEALVGAATAFYKGTKEMVKRAVDGFQGGSHSIDIATSVMTARMERDSNMIQGVLGAVAKTAEALPAGVGKSAEFVSKMAQATEQERLELAKFITEATSKELKKTSDAFASVSKAGIIVTGGLTGLRDAASDAGMRTDDWAKAVASSSEAIKNSGLGVVDSLTILNKASKDLRSSDLGKQLRGLGVTDTAEQMELAAETMRRMTTAGRSRAEIEHNLAKETVKYTKELKVLSALTEGDAKQKLEAARRASLKAEVISKLETPEQQAKFQSAMATFPPELQNGIMDLIATGATTDQNLLVAMSQNEQLRKAVESTVSGIKDSSMKPEDFQKGMFQGLKQAGETARTSQGIQQIAGAGRLSGDATLMASSNIQSALIALEQNLKGDSIKQAYDSAADGLKEGGDKLTRTVNDLADQSNTAAVALENFFTPQLINAASNLVTELGKVEGPVGIIMGLAQKAAEISAPTKRSNTEDMLSAGAMGSGALAGAATGALIGSIVPVIGTTIGAAIGAVAGGAAGYFGYESTLTKPKEPGAERATNPAGAATGAVLSGPKTGYKPDLEMHGKEAIVPLENLQSVMAGAMVTGFRATEPKNNVTVDQLASLTASFKESLPKQTDVIDKKDTGRSLDEMLESMTSKLTAEPKTNELQKLAERLAEHADLLRTQIGINKEISARLSEHIGVSREILQVSR